MTKAIDEIAEEYASFLRLNEWKRLKEITKLLDFYTAGETNNKLLLFFLMIGNLHEKFKSFIIYRGDPGGGKNIICNTVLKLIPKKHIYILDGATAKALNYDENLRNANIIYLRELEQHESVIEILKGLYNADGRIFKETIQDKDSKAHFVKHHEISPKGVITTFSFENIKSDIISRSWVLNPDESHQQTRDIIKFEIDNEKNLIERKITEKKIEEKCFFISQCVQSLRMDYTDIFIPYIDKLDILLPDNKLNVRRDKTKLFNLIKIITLWNQFNRRIIVIGEEEYLLAEYTDLRMALEICQDLFVNLVLQIDFIKKGILDYMIDIELIAKTHSTDVLSYGTQKERIEIKHIEKNKKYTITEIHEEINSDQSVSRRTIQRKLNDLFYDGYLLREKENGKYYYSKLRDYNLINMIELNTIKEEINSIVDQTYIHYSNKTYEMLEKPIENDTNE